MLYEEIRTKQNLSYIALCSLSILYNSKFILSSLGTNVVVVTRVTVFFLFLHKLMSCSMSLELISNEYAHHGKKTYIKFIYIYTSDVLYESFVCLKMYVVKTSDLTGLTLWEL